ncbi:MAG: hypothetical protein ACI8RD_007825 [Bacillariaceae sp.]|jgi:hypothetical protein
MIVIPFILSNREYSCSVVIITLLRIQNVLLTIYTTLFFNLIMTERILCYRTCWGES